MEIYEYDKSFLDRFEESMLVLSLKEDCVSAAEIKSLWCSYIELQIEPAGWQTIWKVPRVICEELKVRFPLIVFGRVEHVLVEDLKATFYIEAVQDEDVHLPECHDVSLIDLYPTINQENNALNVEKTAECLDRLRFFFTNVWMPWDNDSDLNWHEKLLEQRIRFCYDLRTRKIDETLSAHIRNLLTEAKYLQQRREYLELEDEESDDFDESLALDKSQISELVRIHFRLNIIRGEVEILENPEMRRVYEEGQLDKDAGETKGQGIKNYTILLPASIQKQLKMLKTLENSLKDESDFCISYNLQETLNSCHSSAKLYLSPGVHNLKGYGYRSNDGMISGIVAGDEKDSQEIQISCLSDDEILIGFDGDYTLRNLTLNCSNVRTGLLIKCGHLRLYNCRLVGDAKSSTKRGIVCSRNASVSLYNCVLEGFGSTLVIHDNTNLTMNETCIRDCRIGIDIIGSKDINFDFKNSQIINATDYGLYASSIEVQDAHLKKLALSSIEHISKYLNSRGSLKFAGCKTNICLLNQNHSMIIENSKKSIYDDDDEVEDSESSMLIDASPNKSSAKRHCVSQTIELTNCNN